MPPEFSMVDQRIRPFGFGRRPFYGGFGFPFVGGLLGGLALGALARPPFYGPYYYPPYPYYGYPGFYY
ncbi:hypothetical protein [Bacillus sp. ISL-47]|uniref:hypothetical protein n=1 Tax=Bacillus sp. ISL-47 TaxID=2819130 RepID=UPI002035CE91|nr:hypothetical protein [Bacillus sp. ISL-47]